MAGVDPRELIRAALKRYSGDEAGAFVETFWDRPAARRGTAERSRQATHARMQRARALGVAGSLALACEDARLGDVFLDPRVALLRPLSAAVHSRVVHLRETAGAFTPAGLEALWARLAPRYLELGARIDRLDRDGLLVIHSLQTALALGAIFEPRRFADHWRDLWRAADRRGLLGNPHLRMQLAILGSHVGQVGAHVDWLSNPRVHAFDLADTLCFVRRDNAPALLDQVAASIRGDSVDPQRWGLALVEAPAAAWVRMADYVRACTRLAGHFTNEGQVLMVLSWVEDITRRKLLLRQRDGSTAAVKQLCRALRRIEAVQAIEKSRFYRLVERVAEGPLRERLVQIWNDSYAPASELAVERARAVDDDAGVGAEDETGESSED